jgi:predicted SAM-dependent methyltransferase
MACTRPQIGLVSSARRLVRCAECAAGDAQRSAAPSSDVFKMKYADIDKVLTPWSKRHGLHVFTKYRDEEVRSIDVVDDAGGRYQIWISEAENSGRAKVSAWNYKDKKKTVESSFLDLEQALEELYSEVMLWMVQTGHTRTPVL